MKSLHISVNSLLRKAAKDAIALSKYADSLTHAVAQVESPVFIKQQKQQFYSMKQLRKLK